MKKEVVTSQFTGETHGPTASMTFMITKRVQIVEVLSQRTALKKEGILQKTYVSKLVMMTTKKINALPHA